MGGETGGGEDVSVDLRYVEPSITDVLSGRARWCVAQGDCREVIASMPERSVHCVVTSPPYFGLRDYGVEGQIGLESSLDEYIAALVGLFREVRRVLRDDGTVWLNIGDSYAANRPYQAPSTKGGAKHSPAQGSIGASVVPRGLKPKDLIGVPWRVAFALQADGWWLRDDIVWAKQNPMPESVEDRPTRAHEFVFLLTKSERYFYDADAIREPHADPRANKAGHNCMQGQASLRPRGNLQSADRYFHPAGRNKRDVWSIASEGFDGAHFAVMPTALVEPCVLAGTSFAGCCPACGTPWRRLVEREPEEPTERGLRLARAQVARSTSSGGTERTTLGSGGTKRTTTGWAAGCECDAGDPRRCVVLDPFGGSGTVGAVALGRQRSAIVCELNPEFAEMSRGRCREAEGPLFASSMGST